MRNFKRTLSFVSLLIIAICMAQATPRSVQQAKKIAQQHALKMGIALQPDGLTQKTVKASKIAAAPGAQPTADSYYVFENGDDRGFTIVSGDDRLPDIVGYSLTGSSISAVSPMLLFITCARMKKWPSVWLRATTMH